MNWATIDGVARSDAVAGWIFGQWSRHPVAMILLVAAGDAALLILYAFGPRALIFGEDRSVEMATALLFLAAFVVGILHLCRSRRRDYPILLPVAAALGLIGFLDETSFGARIFGWSMPAMADGGEFDGAHDLVILIYRLALRADPMLIAAVAAGASLVAFVFAVRRRKALHALALRIGTDPTYLAMALFVAGVAFACLLDLEVGILRRLGPLEEIAELNAALALLVAVTGASGRRARPGAAIGITTAAKPDRTTRMCG